MRRCVRLAPKVLLRLKPSESLRRLRRNKWSKKSIRINAKVTGFGSLEIEIVAMYYFIFLNNGAFLWNGGVITPRDYVNTFTRELANAGITIFDSVVNRSLQINSITGDTLEKITTSLSNNNT